MIPLHLSLVGFLSYRDPVELDFRDFDLACISGPNGAGKSSLLDAITWALFGQGRKRDDSLINTQSDQAEVRLTFAYEGNVYRVVRTKPRNKTTILEFQILQTHQPLWQANQVSISELGPWKALTERTMRDTEDRIQQTLRLDYETFVNASFFLQGKADQFTQQGAGDRKRILSSILGLEVWGAYRQQAMERLKVVEDEIASLDGRLHEIGLELDEEAVRKRRLAELESSLARLAEARAAQERVLDNARQIAVTLAEQRKLVDALARQLEVATRQLTEMETRLTARQKEQGVFAETLSRAAAIEAAHAAWQTARADLQRWEETADRFREQEKRRQQPLDEINAARARLTQEQATLESQRAAHEDQQRKLGELQSEIEVTRQRLQQTEEQLTQRARLEAETNDAHRQQAEAKAENTHLKAEMHELQARIGQLEAIEGAACPVCGQPLNPTERQNLIDDLKDQGQQMGNRYRANQALMRDIEQTIRHLENQIAQLAEADAAQRAQVATLAQLNTRLEAIQQAAADWEARGAPRLREVAQSLEHETFAAEARAHLAEIDAELKAIGYDAQAHDLIRRAEQEGRAIEEEVRTLERARAALSPLEREITDLEAQIERLRGGVAEQQEEHDRAAVSLAAAQASAPDVEQTERELFNLRGQENRLRMEVGGARQKVDALDALRKRAKSLRAERAELALQVGQYKQLERAFGKDGVPALLIEQALPQIEEKANEVLDRLSASTMSVRFVTQAAYKDKRREDLRETLEIQISDNAGTRDYDMFSGGEAFRVNFAVRLALSEVLAQRAGARLQTLVIDEGFGSQDAEGRQRLVEAINLVRQDFAKILVITHIDELKDAFPTRIEVEKSARGSTLHVR